MWCIGTTSATTYAIIGSLNKVPIALLGYLMFQTAISREVRRINNHNNFRLDYTPQKRSYLFLTNDHTNECIQGAIFVGLSMLGGFMYSHAKIMESRVERGREKSDS